MNTATTEVHLNLVFENNTPTGGDMGAHVMAPAYLRDNLLPHFQSLSLVRPSFLSSCLG